MRERHRRQQGQIAIITIFFFALIVSVSLFGYVRVRSTGLDDAVQTERALAQARQALIAYASGRPSSNRPGELPCPDTNNNGTAENACTTAASRVGRLPFSTLGIDDLRDGSGERLWYAVSNTFRTSSGVTPLNSNTNGQFSVTGLAPASTLIAIVFAPGSVVTGQSRTAANANNVAHYLDGENANGDNIFTTALSSATFNDRLLAITPAMFYPQVEMRVAREARLFLNAYFTQHGFFPVANPFVGTGCTSATQGRIAQNPQNCGNGQQSWGGIAIPTWFWSDAWDQILHYAPAPACSNPAAANCSGAGGYLSVNGTGNVRAVIMSPGPPYSGQARPCTNITDCLEAPNTTSYPSYTHNTGSATLNDRVVVVAP